MLAEGKNPVREALKSGQKIEKIIVQDKTTDREVREMVALARDARVRVEFAPKMAFDRLSKTGHHQGIIAELSEYDYALLDDVLANLTKRGVTKRFILLDGVEDPHNLGSVIRSAECLGFNAVIIPERRSALVNETVLRASSGAASFVPVTKVKNLGDAIRTLKDNNVFVYAADMDGEIIEKANLKGDIAIVVGGEGSGVSALSRKLADGIVAIPMKGKVNSLNAGVSAAICMYEVMRQGKDEL